MRDHTFRIHAPDAQRVMVVGDFNEWDAVNNDADLRQTDGGWWAITLQLPNRPQHYLLVVDGELQLDPMATGRVRHRDLDREVSFIPGDQR